MAGDVVFELDRLHIATDGGAGPAVEIVRDVSVALRRGEVLALAGESGSGKTTIGMCALGYCKPGLRVSGGQVRLFGFSPVVPSSYGNGYAYGHIVRGGRHMIISGGFGVSRIPVRFGVPPEIVLLDLGHPPAVAALRS